MLYCEHFPLKLYLLYPVAQKSFLIWTDVDLERRLRYWGRQSRGKPVITVSKARAKKGRSRDNGTGQQRRVRRLCHVEWARETLSGVRALKAPLNLAISKLFAMLVKIGRKEGQGQDGLDKGENERWEIRCTNKDSSPQILLERKKIDRKELEGKTGTRNSLLLLFKKTKNTFGFKVGKKNNGGGETEEAKETEGNLQDDTWRTKEA